MAATTHVVEELCMDPDCPGEPETHWHPFSVEEFRSQPVGEYTVTLRVRAERLRARSGRSAL